MTGTSRYVGFRNSELFYQLRVPFFGHHRNTAGTVAKAVPFAIPCQSAPGAWGLKKSSRWCPPVHSCWFPLLPVAFSDVECCIMKHILLLRALSTFGTNAVMASPHKVKIYGEGKTETGAIANALKARINGTERYQTVEDLKDEPELLVSVLCMSTEKYHLTGAICSYSFLYAPVYLPHFPLVSLLMGEPGQVAGPSPEQLAEMIF